MINSNSDSQVQRHRILLDEEGLVALGREETSPATKTALKAMGIFFILTVVFAIPFYLLERFYSRSIAKKVIAEDNVQQIAMKCLFKPQKEEISFLQKNKLITSSCLLDPANTEVFESINQAHEIYSFASSFANVSSSCPLKEYPKCGAVRETITSQSKEIIENKCSYTAIPETYKSLVAVNKALTLFPNKDVAYSLLDNFLQDDETLLTFNSKQFLQIANIYCQLIKQEFEPAKAKEAVLCLQPLLTPLYANNHEAVAIAFGEAFMQNSYLRNDILNDKEKFETQFTECIKGSLSELNDPDKLQVALIRFQEAFNHAKDLKIDLAKNYGEKNVSLVLEVLKAAEPAVAAGFTAFEDSEFAKKTIEEQLAIFIPTTAKKIGLSEAVVEKVIAKEIKQESLEEKEALLQKLKRLFEKTDNSKLMQKWFVLFSDEFLERIDEKTYWSAWKEIVRYAHKHFLSESKYAIETVISAVAKVVQQRTNQNNHNLAIEHMGHACDAFAAFNRDRREQIREELQAELDLLTFCEELKTVQTDQVASAIALRYSLESSLVDTDLKLSSKNDLAEKLRSLKKLATLLPQVKKVVNEPFVVETFINAYGLEAFMQLLEGENALKQLAAIFAYGKELSQKGVYSSVVMAEALGKTLKTLGRNDTPIKALKALHAAATSWLDNEQDEDVKCLLQKTALQSHVTAIAKSQGYCMREETLGFLEDLLGNFIVHKDLPKKSSLNYVSSAICTPLSLHLKKEATDTAIAFAFIDSARVQFDIKKLDESRLDEFSQVAQKNVKLAAVERAKVEHILRIDQEKLAFPLFIELLPGCCAALLACRPENFPPEIGENLKKIHTNFHLSGPLKLELQEAYEHVKLLYASKLDRKEMLFEVLKTGLKIAVEELEQAQQNLNQPHQGESNAQKSLFGPMLQSVLSLAVNSLQNIHEKHLSKQTSTAVHLTPTEKILMDLLNDIPKADSWYMKAIDVAANFFSSSGGRWLTQKIVTARMQKALENLKITPHHKQFLIENSEHLLAIVSLLLPHLMQLHNIPDCLGKIDAIKAITLCEENSIDQTKLKYTLLDLFKTLVKDFDHYEPIIIASLDHIHAAIQK